MGLTHRIFCSLMGYITGCSRKWGFKKIQRMQHLRENGSSQIGACYCYRGKYGNCTWWYQNSESIKVKNLCANECFLIASLEIASFKDCCKVAVSLKTGGKVRKVKCKKILSLYCKVHNYSQLPRRNRINFGTFKVAFVKQIPLLLYRKYFATDYNFVFTNLL